MPSLYLNFSSHSIFSPPSANHSLRLKFSVNVHLRKITCDLHSTEPHFETISSQITLLKPYKDDGNNGGPLLVYAPGMDCTGRGIRKQLPSLYSAGYDVRCIYIPSTDRSSWTEIVDTLIPLLEGECHYRTQNRHVTLMGESFGAVLALRIACAAPKLISRMIIINSASNLKLSNPFASFFAQTGLLPTLPHNIYLLSQRIAVSLMVRSDLISNRGIGDLHPFIDFLPADCVAWRFSMLNDDAGLSEDDIRSINIPTLVIVSAEDYVLSSLAEGARLQNLLENAKRVTLPQSGHAVLLEDSIDLVAIMQANGFYTPNASISHIFQNNEAFLRRKKAVQDEVLDEMGSILAPWRFLTSPLISGEENLPNPCLEPRRPVLFVGNHTLFGGYDTPILLYELFLRGFHARALAHPGHWHIMTGSIFERYGHVKASKFAAYQLLKDGESILLFPGGAREVNKKKGESYKLVWKSSTEFVRMASRFKAIIIPFAALGGDDAFTVLTDSEELLDSPIGPFLKEICSRLNLSTEVIPPITALPGTTIPSLFPIPSIERIYFHFADPIDTASYSEILNDREQFTTLHSLVKKRVEESIDKLQHIRLHDPERGLPQRLTSKISRLVSNIYKI